MKKLSKYIRNALCIGGFIAGFISAGLSDGAYLMGTDAGAAGTLFWVALAMMIPTLIHLAKAGEL